MTATVSPEQARADAGAVPDRACENCRWFHVIAGNPQGACMFAPPVVHMILVPASKLDPKSMQQVPANTRPTVNPSDVCSHHRFEDEPSDAEMIADLLDEIAKWLREGITTGRK